MKRQNLYLIALCASFALMAACDDKSSGKSCDSDADCGELSCDVIKGECYDPVPAHCKNDVKDEDETGKNCGGSECVKCAIDEGCNTETDCVTNYCDAASHLCKPEPCDEETKCPGVGGTCDTTLGYCISCEDEKQNGTESYVDCGGSCTNKCKEGQMCKGAGDCETGVCNGTGQCGPKAAPVTLTNLMINEVGGSADNSEKTKKPFVFNDNADACEFIEIANLSNDTASMDGVELVLLRTDDGKNTTTTIPLSGGIQGKGLFVVHDCENGLPVPSDTTALFVDKKNKMLTDTGIYDITLKKDDAVTTAVTAGKFSKKGTSYNRATDFSIEAEMVLHTEVNPDVYASPGYCANGGKYSENCVVSGGGGGGGGGTTDPVDITKLFINEVFGAKGSHFKLNDPEEEADTCEFIEIAYSDNKKASLDGVEIVTIKTGDTPTTKNIPLSGTVTGPALIVVNNCSDPISLPDDAVDLNVGGKLQLTDGGVYDLKLQKATSEFSAISLPAKFTKGVSFNRSTDMDPSATEMKLHTEVNPDVNASPGYCANGNLYSTGCQSNSGGGGNGGGGTGSFVDKLLVTEVLFFMDDAIKKFDIIGDADICKFIEFVNTDNVAHSLNDITMVIQYKTPIEIVFEEAGDYTIGAHNAFVIGSCDLKAQKPNGGLRLPDGVQYRKISADNLDDMLPNAKQETDFSVSIYFKDKADNRSRSVKIEDIPERPYAGSYSYILPDDLTYQADMVCDPFDPDLVYTNSVGLCNNGALYTDNCELKCNDGNQQIGETDVDCGGVCRTKKVCDAGQMCLSEYDCSNGNECLPSGAKLVCTET